MYVRFWRWASDRLKGEGVIAFVINRSFIEKIAFDGFRLSIAQEFAECWLMDLGGDVRANPKLSGTKHNAMGIQTGLAIAFMVRKKDPKGFKLFYARRPEDETAKDKLGFLESVDDFERWEVGRLKPDAKGNWLSRDHPDWIGYLPLVDPAKGSSEAHGAKVEAIFRITSNGLQTKRDDWAYDRTAEGVAAKMKVVLAAYNKRQEHPSRADNSVKWDRESERRMRSGIRKQFNDQQIIQAYYRPFGARYVYFDVHLNSMTFRLPTFYQGEPNPTICYLGIASQNEFAVLAAGRIFDMGLVKAGNGSTQGVARYRYIATGERVDNITDWALNRFRNRYADPAISKDDIFAYCYAVLYDPIFRKTHAADLRREFPRVPLYPDFLRWRVWGERLLRLHIDYTNAKPFELTRTNAASRAKASLPRPILRSLPEAGTVIIDADTRLTDIPTAPWSYRLGNRSAIDWVLDQHKEKTPRDPTIRADFNTFRFGDHKEAMINLIAKVVTVSLETLEITEAMLSLDRADHVQSI